MIGDRRRRSQRGILSRLLAATTNGGTVQGTISGPGVTDFSSCLVFLFNATTGATVAPTSPTPTSPSGAFVIPNVPTGKWRVMCFPPRSMPLEASTYDNKYGYSYSSGTVVSVATGATVTVNFALRPAGFLRVRAINLSGRPVAGVTVVAFEPSRPVLAVPNTTTNSNGYADFANVPISSKVGVFDFTNSVAIFTGGASNWRAASVVRLPGQAAYKTITLTLPE